MAEVSSGFSKDTTLLELKVRQLLLCHIVIPLQKYLGLILNCPPSNITLSLVKRSSMIESYDHCVI